MALSPEVLLISSIITNSEMKLALVEGALSEYFHLCKDEFEWMESYFTKYRRTPSRAAFHRAFPKFRIRDVNDTQHFVHEVRVEHTRALLLENLRDQTDLLAQGQVQEAIDLAQTSIVKIASKVSVNQDIDVLADWKTTYNEVKARKMRVDQFGMAGVPTGFPTLDENTGGIGPGQLWVVGARLGEGKSWGLACMTCSAIINGNRAHFAALEMSKTEVAIRLQSLLSSSAGASAFQAIQLSQGKNFDLKAYRKFLDELPKKIKGQVTVSDTRNLGIGEIAAQMERHNPEVYYLDYLSLAKMKGDGGWQDIGNFSKGLKSLAGQYDVGVVAAAQLNRSGAEKSNEPPGAETIALADAIGQDADAVITLKKISQSVTMFRLAKYRHGRDGFCWYMHMDLDHGVIEEVSKNRADELKDKDADRRDKELAKERPHIKRKPTIKTRQMSVQQEAIEGSGRRRVARKASR